MRSSSADDDDDDDDIGNLIDKSFFDYVGELQIKVKILHQTHAAKSDVVKKKPLLSYFFSLFLLYLFKVGKVR